MTNYKCPCCGELLHLVDTNARDGSIDLHFECMTCAHLLGIVINVPTFVPLHQWYSKMCNQATEQPE